MAQKKKISKRMKKPNIKDESRTTPPEFNRVSQGKIRRVKCLIFQAKNETIQRITQALNEEENIEQKDILAQRLLDEVEELLACEYFNETRADCRVCQAISEIWKKTSELILKVGEMKYKNS